MKCAYCRECELVGDAQSEGASHTHQSGIMEVVGCQLVVSSMIFSEPPNQRKTTCQSGANVFSGSVATKLRRDGKSCMHLEAMILKIMCAKYYEHRFKLL